MEAKLFWVHLLFLVLVLVLSFCVVEIHGRGQGEALSRLYNSKFKGKVDVETSFFEEIKDLDSSKIYSDDLNCMKEQDKIEKWPGQPPVGFSQYGGYVTVDKSAGRAFYYYFAEADHHLKDSLPLLLWLNGGPGCSSLAYGAMQELGPFRIHSDGKTLFRNRYSWNKAANVLFLESPAGVGFSYSNTTSDYGDNGDRKTAEDNYVFLVNWLKRFPEYIDRDFYIAGESYAGHYVPQLAHTILKYNSKYPNKTIHLKGIIIGNAVINDETDQRGMYDYFETHALISDQTNLQIQKHCDFSPNPTPPSSECALASNEVDRNTYYLDIYNIYAPMCFFSNLTTKPRKASIWKFDPCSDYYGYAYLNNPAVQKAIHANVTKLTHDWEACSDVIGEWGDSPYTIIPLLREFMANNLRVWIFSGDTDGRVPVTSTKYSIKAMNLTVETPWHPWYFGWEIGGYTEVYEGNMTFATVRGAGHEVPSYQPRRALSLISHFLNGTPLPDTTRY